MTRLFIIISDSVDKGAIPAIFLITENIVEDIKYCRNCILPLKKA